MKTNPANRNEKGQALVEFVIILIFIMAMCAGMISSIRLLGFQFWAQQEARFLAYEQEWAPHDFYGDPVNDPIGKLNDGDYFGRPGTVSDRTSTKNVSNDGALPELLSWLKPAATEKIIGESSASKTPVMFAKNETPWWKGRAADWFREGGTLDRAFGLVDNAFASVDFFHTVKSDGAFEDSTPDNPFPVSDSSNYQDRLQGKLKNYFEGNKVGPKVCQALRNFSTRNADPALLFPFRQEDCGEKIQNGLAWNIAHNVDIKDFFHSYGEEIETGFQPSEAIEHVIRVEVANQFYSLFDTLVNTARIGAVPLIIAGRIDTGLDLADSKVTGMISDARYVGSSVAIAAILGEGVNIGLQSPSNSDSDVELNFENSVNQILHTDVDGQFLSAFFLGPQYLPVPPTFGAAAPGLQEAVMKNLLSRSGDSGIRDQEIANANKTIEVSYESQGAFDDLRLAKENVRGVDDSKLVARYYLVTQPWHLKRREGGTGEYRDKGAQTDDDTAETEEALLRRRVFGLFLFPSSPTVFLEPISDVLGLDESLKDVFEVFEGFDTVIGFIKDFVLDNPIFDVFQALSEIPVLGSLIPVPPELPAVRPDAYPGSTEMTANDPSQPDKLMNTERNFSDYVDEQRDSNPPPNPTFY